MCCVCVLERERERERENVEVDIERTRDLQLVNFIQKGNRWWVAGQPTGAKKGKALTFIKGVNLIN